MIGAILFSGQLSSSSGLLRNNSNGDLIAGYCRKFGGCSPVRAELWAIRDGLHMAWKRGYKQVIIESDNKIAVDGIIKAPVGTTNDPLIRRIREFYSLSSVKPSLWQTCWRRCLVLHKLQYLPDGGHMT